MRKDGESKTATIVWHSSRWFWVVSDDLSVSPPPTHAGSWQGVAADNVELRTPEERFPLERIGFARKQLTAVRSICCLWLNDAWLTQSPLPGLSPVSCKSQRQTTFLLQIANITPVKPGSTPPNGFPPIVLRALRAAIEQCREDLSIRRSPLGWPQGRALSLTLEILKEELGA